MSETWSAFGAKAPEPPWRPQATPATRPARGEKATVLEHLATQRATLLEKCRGLDAEQMARRAVPPSTLSMVGLVRHLTGVEHHWFRRVLGERLDLTYLWAGDPSNGFDDVTPTPQAVAEAWESWQAEVDHADELTSGLPEEAFEVEIPKDGDSTISVRDLVVHVVEEYARHLGHADLLRERLDGSTGE
ncbi:MAG: DinB family protein [Nocardioides sp.]|uniref:DinB family protein n=1 Tax=Nocardioides sp. TaxID=35761 RepID=UPI003F10B9F5